MKRRILAPVFVLVLVTACSGGGEDATTTVPSTTTPQTGDATITISGFSFGEPLTVAVGEEVTVVNQDALPHTWTSSEGIFDSGSLSRGEEFSFAFDEAGEYQFVCSIHPEMTGSITVEG